MLRVLPGCFVLPHTTPIVQEGLVSSSRLYDDVHAVDRLMRERHAVDLTADASGSGRIVSDPAEATASDQYRMSSPNRIDRDSTMRSRRFRRSR